ncbi:hypothetical protein FIBSPDRAFT_970161 [Athelia psychrophila]|uniref:Uncharacterized protein n=1 Tax=Athelia psychrophila TaxID=1759441 RepID=A0A167SW63_9AGAM|nr:hypothetical protein FIBSPDRAFT_970161 [Fibularhizoctonia sp. CBS 109695]
MANCAYVIIDRPSSPNVPPDSVIVSYLKQIAAADQNSVRHKQQKDPQQYRLASQFDPDIIKVILRYAKGRYSRCHHQKCLKRIHMTDALRKFKACALCRAKAALSPTALNSPDANTDVDLSDDEASDAASTSIDENDQADGDTHTTDTFSRNLYANVERTYLKGRQITFDERFAVLSPDGRKLSATMSFVIEGMQDTLYRIWPRARELSESNMYHYVDGDIVCTRTFPCCCWAPDFALGLDGHPSQECGGRVNFVGTPAPWIGTDVHEVHVAFVHPG